MIYDCVVIGAGPAGVSAALNLQIHEKRFIWFGRKALSEKIEKAEQIRNYPGFIDASGAALAKAFGAHIEAMGIDITDQMVNSIMPMGDHYALSAGTEFYETRTILLATGVNQTGGLAREAEFVGRGVSYCATCDGGLYRGRTIGVICAGARFEHEARYLAGLAGKVYFFPYYKNAGAIGENVETPASLPVGVEGSERVTGLALRDGTTLAVEGVFCLRGAIALDTLLPGLATEDGHIAVDRRMATNLPGVFAAGDCTGRPYQYAKAVGEGNVAAHAILDYLASQAKPR